MPMASAQWWLGLLAAAKNVVENVMSKYFMLKMDDIQIQHQSDFRQYISIHSFVL